jgi:cyanate lyase
LRKLYPACGAPPKDILPFCHALIEEEFGDGIMSAISFELIVDRVPDPKRDRVKVTLNGKFLPYRRC